MTVEPYRPLELMQREDFTKSDFDDFIGVWENFMPRPTCKKLIQYCEHVIDTGSYYNQDFQELPGGSDQKVYKSEDHYGGAHNRRDFAFMMDYSNKKLCTDVQAILASCLQHYITQYPSLNIASLISTDIKMQKTPPGGGYHLWHYEDVDQAHSLREITWMIYLNDMPEGEAETEFLYQKRRISPTAGTVVIWPAGYTHTHKGNTVFSEDKYILTGWYIKSR